MAVCSTGKYTKIFTLTVSNTFSYISEILIRIFFLVMILYVFTNLWKAVYETGGKQIEGFSLTDILWYLMFTESLVTSRGKIESKIDEEVKSGNIAYSLNKPYNYIIFQFFFWLGESLPSFIFNLCAGSILVYFMAGSINFNFSNIPYLILILFLSAVIEFLIRMIIGLSAFWMEDINMISFIYYKLVFVFGGMLIPLEFFPSLFKTIAKALPFTYIVYYPARLFVKFDFNIFMEVIKGQTVWIIIISIICWIIYSFGLRRININGG